MKKLIFVLFALLWCSNTVIGQNKITLKKGLKLQKFRTGQLIGVTLKGEAYKHEGWKNLNKNDKEVKENFWILDSIGEKALKIITYKYEVTYKLDTLSGKKSIKDKDYILKEVLKSEIGKDGYYKVVYKTPTINILIDKTRIITYDSIESFTALKANFAKSVTHMSRIHFNYPFGDDSKGVKKGLAIALIILAVVSGVVIETSYNATVTIVEKLDRRKEFSTKRYKINEWKLSVETNPNQ